MVTFDASKGMSHSTDASNEPIIIPALQKTRIYCTMKMQFPHLHYDLINHICTTEVEIQCFLWFLCFNTAVSGHPSLF